MKPEAINPMIREYLRIAKMTTDADIDRAINIGLHATIATQFAEQVAIFVGAEGVYLLNEFYRNFLGDFDYICVDKTPTALRIRLVDQIGDTAQEGVELTFIQHGNHWTIPLHRLHAVLDSTTKKLMKEYSI